MSARETDQIQAEEKLPEWAEIQRKTFTRWCNQQLKPRNLHLENLDTGLKDGVNLVNLVEILAKPANPVRYNKRPRIKMQMVENIGIGLKMLTDDGIKLVNIGNNDIHGGNMKLILGLVWTLILHYQISLDFQDQREDDKEKKQKEKGGSAKKQLQNWATDLINDLPSGKTVSNFTTDWNDGIALCSMVEAVAPGLCPEYGILDPADKIGNAQLGLDRAELGLGVEKIIEAEDLVNPNIDELSVLTYVSLLKNATPIIDIKPSDPQRVRVHGLEKESATVGSPVFFYIDTSAAGLGKLDVEIRDSEGKQVPFETLEKDSEIKIQYIPEISGEHKFHIEYNKKCIPEGDFFINISELIEEVEFHTDETEAQTELFPEEYGAELDTELNPEPRPEESDTPEEDEGNFELLTEEARAEEEAVTELILVAEDIIADTAKDDDNDPALQLVHVLNEEVPTLECKPQTPVNIICAEERIETKCEPASSDEKTEELSEPETEPEKCHPMNTVKSEGEPPEDITNTEGRTEDIANTDERTEVISKIKPLSHVISACFLVVSLALVASTGEENLPDRTEAALVSLFLAYLATFAAVDQEILAQEDLAEWLKTSFNLAVGPILIVYLGCSIYGSDLGSMEMTLGSLLLVELYVLKEQLDMRVIAKGVLVSLGGFVVVRCFGGPDVGQLQPIIE